MNESRPTCNQHVRQVIGVLSSVGMSHGPVTFLVVRYSLVWYYVPAWRANFGLLMPTAIVSAPLLTLRTYLLHDSFPSTAVCVSYHTINQHTILNIL